MVKLPTIVHNQLVRLMPQFLWKGSNKGGGLALVSWEVAYKPTEKGGLVIIHLSTLYEALLSKWVSNIINAREEMLLC